MTATAEVTAIATRQDYSREQIDLIKSTICVGATDNELALFVQTAKRMQLDPFARQIFAVKRWNKNAGREVMSTQVSIDGFRLVAERTGKYAGQLGPFWTADGKEWVDVWLDSKPPRAAKVGVLRHDFKEPLWAVATWEEYKQEGRNGLSPMWQKMGALMLAKCAESLGLRRAFPNELSGIYSDAEMAPAATAEVVETTEAATNEQIRGALGDVPKAGAWQQTQKPSDLAPPAVAPATAATTSKAPRAPSIKHDGTFANHKQVALLHILKSKLGMAECKGDCAVVVESTPKWGQEPKKTTRRCPYHTQLAAFKDCDGKPILSSKDLSEAQISNLIDRYDAKVKQQAVRADELPDIAVIDEASESQVAELENAVDGDEARINAICDTLRVMSISDIRTKERVSQAIALALAFGTGSFEAIQKKVMGTVEP